MRTLLVPQTCLAYFRERSVENFGGCWLWTLAVHETGYPMLYRYDSAKGRGVGIKAHRAAYEAANGPIPAGMTVDHLCFMPTCVNPEHLQLLTRSDNSKRQRSVLVGKCRNGHPFGAVATYTGPDGQRRCRICATTRKRDRERQARKEAVR